MAYITENQLSNTVDIPVALPATSLRMGDWLVVAAVKVIAPMRLTYRYANLQLLSANVDMSLITSGNKIYGNLGLVYLALRYNYTNGSPGAAGGLDVLVNSSVGDVTRDTAVSIVMTEPGVYSWVLANNMRPSTDVSPLISPSTSIDFRAAVTASARFELISP